MINTLEELVDELKTSEGLIERLETIRDLDGQSKAGKSRANFFLIEVIEDEIDEGGSFYLTTDYIQNLFSFSRLLQEEIDC